MLKKRAYCNKSSPWISMIFANGKGPAGREEDDDKIMHVEDAKAGHSKLRNGWGLEPDTRTTWSVGLNDDFSNYCNMMIIDDNSIMDCYGIHWWLVTSGFYGPIKGFNGIYSLENGVTIQSYQQTRLWKSMGSPFGHWFTGGYFSSNLWLMYNNRATMSL